MFVIIVASLCFVAIAFFAYSLYTGVSLRRFLLTIYSFYLNRHVEKAQYVQSLAAHKNVILGEDAVGPYMFTGGCRFYLNAMRAKPLKGVLIGENYYTSNKADALVKVMDDDF